MKNIFMNIIEKTGFRQRFVLFNITSINILNILDHRDTSFYAWFSEK